MTVTKTKIGVGLTTIAIATSLSAAPAPSQKADDDAALTALVDSFTRAQREYDQPKLAALTTPDYVEVSPIGDVDTRDEMLSIYAPDKKRASPELLISDRLVRRRGDSAVLLAKLSFTAPGPGVLRDRWLCAPASSRVEQAAPGCSPRRITRRCALEIHSGREAAGSSVARSIPRAKFVMTLPAMRPFSVRSRKAGTRCGSGGRS